MGRDIFGNISSDGSDLVDTLTNDEVFSIRMSLTSFIIIHTTVFMCSERHNKTEKKH